MPKHRPVGDSNARIDRNIEGLRTSMVLQKKNIDKVPGSASQPHWPHPGGKSSISICARVNGKRQPAPSIFLGESPLRFL
jgi:hypothetical protein